MLTKSFPILSVRRRKDTFDFFMEGGRGAAHLWKDLTKKRFFGFSTRVADGRQHMVKALTLVLTRNIARICPFTNGLGNLYCTSCEE